MKVYRIVWTVAVGALVARGLALGVDRDPALTASVSLLGAAVGVAWSLGVQGRHVGRTAVVTGAAAGAVVGHLPALGAGLLVIAVMVAATAPSARSAEGRRSFIASRPTEAGSSPQAGSPLPHGSTRNALTRGSC
jgi:hypothetical protein